MKKLSINALAVLKKRGYLKRGETVEKMFRRVAKLIAGGTDYEKEFCQMMSDLEYLSGSVLLNAGKKYKQFSACYVLPLEDSLEEIYTQLRNAALITRTGGGLGIPLSNLRPRGSEIKSTGGISGGAVSFAKLFNASAEAISEGSSRRPAMMGVMAVDHPDIEEFIKAKADGENLQFFNVSVGAKDDFMRRVKKDNGAARLFDLIGVHAWQVGDPGMVFLDRMNKDNPTPHLGEYETTNPCFVGSTRVATSFGLLRMDELKEIKRSLLIAVDRRSYLKADNKPSVELGIEKLNSSGVKITGEQKLVLKLITKGGLVVTATPDHRFLTPEGYIELQDLTKGEAVLIQSGEGLWSTKKMLSNRDWMINSGKLLAGRTRAKKEIPQKWSRDLGEVIGWIVGDGWLTKNEKRLGIAFGYKAEEARKIIGGRLKDWFGGCEIEKERVVQLTFSACAYGFFESLGVKPVRAEFKRVPDSIWSAPREAVIGFLRGVFGADGTVQRDDNKQCCSIRLTSVSKLLLEDVQLLLLNLGIWGKIFLRRKPQWREMPNGKGGKKKYWTKLQYELIIGADNKNKFLEMVGFADKLKQKKGEEFCEGMSRGGYKKPFLDVVEKIVKAGKEDVYDLSQSRANSFIANGFVVHNCGEQPLLPYESCNLGNINLGKFVRKDKIDWERLREVIHLGVRFQDRVIDVCDYPISECEEMAKRTRRIGLGVMGWADMLIKLEIPYDSKRALGLAERVAKFIQGEGRKVSVELGKEKGSFQEFEKSIWVKKYPAMRNATINTVAPTGTVSIIGECSSGIEPLFGLAYQRNVLEGETLQEVNENFKVQMSNYFKSRSKIKDSCQRTGRQWSKVLREVIRTGSCQGIKGLSKKIKNVFKIAQEIDWQWHIKMQAAWQKYTDAAVSKTINMPNEATVNEVKEAYRMAWELGCKGITVYRDGCREKQVLNLGYRETCNECGENLNYEGGCVTCPNCGWSKCAL